MRKVLTPRLGLLAAGHLTIDSYSSFFTPLLPLLVEKLHLSLTLVGTLVALASLSSSFAQPLFGLLSDRMRRPWFVAFGPVVAAVFMSAIGLASSYSQLVVLLMLGGIGVAAFHPQAASLVVSPRRSVAMALFITGGTLGFALGPLYAVGIVSVLGLERTWWAMVPGLVVSVPLLLWFARIAPKPRHEAVRPPLRELRPVLRPLSLLYFAVVARSAVSYGFMTFLPLYLSERGYGLGGTGALVSLYLLLGATGGFFGGWLADRWGGRRVIVFSFVLSLPLYVAFLFLDGAWGLACLVVGGFALQSSLPVNIVLGQELAPRHSSTISSLLMGAAWGLGALLIGPVGILADRFGLSSALLVLASVLVAGLGCALALPAPRREVPAAEITPPMTGATGAVGD
jgi:MFS transporter, FSR family, fosmidomycin resistance protein